MTRSSALKKEKQLRLARNTSKSRKIINIVRKNTRELQNYFISNKSQSTSNEQFTYKTRTFTGPSCQKLTDFLKQKGTDDNNNIHDYYQIIHNSFLLQLMKQTVCASCKLIWNGDMSVAKREGLYCSLVFICCCSHEIKFNTSKQCLNTSKRDINVRIFAGFGHQGLVKLCAILNVPLPTDEDHFSDTLDYLLPTFESYKLRSMKNTVEEACKKSNERKITVSGDGTWQKRGFSSLHGVVEVLSNGPTSKVIDLERLSKKCSICTGLLSIKYSDPKKYSEIKNKHQCEVNHVGSSASMKVAGIHRLFARSKMLYNVKYAHYIGDGDAKVFPKLISDPPYEDVSITKIEDVNHFSKKMLHRLQKIAESLKKTNIDGKLGIRGSGRMTKKMMINFKHYYRLAIVRNKTNLDDVVRAVWAIWKHKVSELTKNPMRKTTIYCTLLRTQSHIMNGVHQGIVDIYKHSRKVTKKSMIFYDFISRSHSISLGEEYDHTAHSLPLKIMKAIRPVFEELAHPPKNRYSTGVMIDLCAAMAVSFYNDGYQSIIPILAELTGNTGFFTRVGMKRLDERRIYYEHKRKRKAVQKSKQNEETSDSLSDRMSVDDNRDDQLDDSYIPGAY
ncbi:unnamed protein product [Rotaria magnacalcarata]|uniref:Mutator-like transposase domain-containing protein n=2 Tax=Rotaria magnacalcarata TaxID=392030 RepID=A0A816VDX9_9BILA|nr:unnamed protein product [Rotaria magnacalcarata]